MPTLAHALMLSHAHKPAHAHTQTGRGMEEQIIDVDELVHELPRVAEITELRHSVAVHQLGRRARRHLRHTHTHTLRTFREKTAQAQCDAQCGPRADTFSNVLRKSNAANGEGDERGGDSLIGRSGDERGGERGGDGPLRIWRGGNDDDVFGACGLPLFSRPFPDDRLGLRSRLTPSFCGVDGSATGSATCSATGSAMCSATSGSRTDAANDSAWQPRLARRWTRWTRSRCRQMRSFSCRTSTSLLRRATSSGSSSPLA